MSLYYISFASREKGFLGGCVVEAGTEKAAFQKTKSLRLNPGGEAAIFDVTKNGSPYPLDALLQVEDFERINGDSGKNYADMTEEEKRLFDANCSAKICEPCNDL